MICNILYPAGGHASFFAEDSSDFSESLIPSCVYVYTEPVIPGIVIRRIITELATDPLFAKSFETCSDCKILSHVIPSVEQIILSYIRFIPEAVVIMVIFAVL